MAEKNQCNEERLRMVAGAYSLPKENTPGEDAYFLYEEKQTIGVADGAGRWPRRLGVEPGEYARDLMRNCFIALHGVLQAVVDPKGVLQEAYDNTKTQGSSTACIITLRGNNLRFANVGDSGFMVFRRNRLLYQSPIQERGFNNPYQLGRMSGVGRPSLAYESSVRVESGDVVIAGTDGLLDNLYPYEIEDFLAKGRGNSLEGLAYCLAEFALCNSIDKGYFSPFARAAASAGYKEIGGRYDDITVIAVQIESVPDCMD